MELQGGILPNRPNHVICLLHLQNGAWNSSRWCHIPQASPPFFIRVKRSGCGWIVVYTWHQLQLLSLWNASCRSSRIRWTRIWEALGGLAQRPPLVIHQTHQRISGEGPAFQRSLTGGHQVHALLPSTEYLCSGLGYVVPDTKYIVSESSTLSVNSLVEGRL